MIDTPAPGMPAPAQSFTGSAARIGHFVARYKPDSKPMNNRYRLLPLLLSAGLAACGGGGGDSATPAPATPEIVAKSALLWRATTSTGRSGRLILLDGGRLYFLYSRTNTPDTLGGAVTGLAGASGASSIASTALDFNWEGLPSTSATLSASLDQHNNLNGTLSYSDASRNLSFTSTYEAPAASIVGLTDIAGTYVSPDRTMTLMVAPTGAVSGTAFSTSCRFTGALKQTLNHSSLLHMELTFQGGACALGTSTVSGIAAYDLSQRVLVGVALDGSGATATLFQGGNS